jgi:hypothetical protein
MVTGQTCCECQVSGSLEGILVNTAVIYWVFAICKELAHYTCIHICEFCLINNLVNLASFPLFFRQETYCSEKPWPKGRSSCLFGIYNVPPLYWPAVAWMPCTCGHCWLDKAWTSDMKAANLWGGQQTMTYVSRLRNVSWGQFGPPLTTLESGKVTAS